MILFRKGVFVDVIREEKAAWATRQETLGLSEVTESRTPSLEVSGEQGPSIPLNLEFQKCRKHIPAYELPVLRNFLIKP